MPVKIVPREIATEYRAYVLKFALMVAVPMFVAIALVAYAAYEWIRGYPGDTIWIGIIAFGFVFLTSVMIVIRMGKHEIQMNHSQEEMQFLTDAEAVQLGYLDLKAFMEKHKNTNVKMLRMYSQYLHTPIEQAVMEMQKQGQDKSQ